MQGQANHFRMQATGDSKNVVPYGIKRYHDETVRLYEVLENGLQGRDYLVGDAKGKYSLADILIFPWALWYRFAGIRNQEVGPNVKAWIDRIKARPAVQKGLEVPSKSELLKNLEDVSCHLVRLCCATTACLLTERLLPTAVAVLHTAARLDACHARDLGYPQSILKHTLFRSAHTRCTAMLRKTRFIHNSTMSCKTCRFDKVERQERNSGIRARGAALSRSLASPTNHNCESRSHA